MQLSRLRKRILSKWNIELNKNNWNIYFEVILCALNIITLLLLLLLLLSENIPLEKYQIAYTDKYLHSAVDCHIGNMSSLNFGLDDYNLSDILWVNKIQNL